MQYCDKIRAQNSVGKHLVFGISNVKWSSIAGLRRCSPLSLSLAVRFWIALISVIRWIGWYTSYSCRCWSNRTIGTMTEPPQRRIIFVLFSCFSRFYGVVQNRNAHSFWLLSVLIHASCIVTSSAIWLFGFDIRSRTSWHRCIHN